MSRRSLTREGIVSAALQMIDEKGTDAFSVRQLASSLGVQVSSLYNHIENENDLLLEVAKRTGEMYTDFVAGRMGDLPLDEAIFKAGDAFREFIRAHRYLYELMLDGRWVGNAEFAEANERFTQPIFWILKLYGVEDPAEMEHLYVAMRIVTHGFSSLDALGVFDGLSVDTTESYHRMIGSVIKTMKAPGKKGD
ncbi:MAG: TetR/AcrR family transcriptional regulator [Oscillospiraceae bacterium]|nr:TetR/AcrR family transcriptional regulator [Oscillospiraceae bacterium]